MKKLLLATLLCALSVVTLRAQINISGSTGVDGTYPTLTAAFTAINGGPAQTGNTIFIRVLANTNEGTGTATLNAGAWTTLRVFPSGGAWTIAGGTTAGNPLIDLNGADNVTFDGVNSGGDALTIENTTVSATSGTSTIRFQTDATSNTITRCAVKGASTMAVGTNGGNIFFAAGAVTTGNDNNTVSFCDIGPSGTNLPSKGVYFSGTTTTTALNNSGINITSNNIFDYFSATTTSAGVYVTSGATDINVQNNKFYQTATRTHTSGSQHSAVWITNTSGNNYLVSGNTIGYSSNTATGTYTLVGLAASTFIPVFINVGSTTATSIQGNTITALAFSGTMAGTTSAAALRMIYIAEGLTNIGNVSGNTIGSLSANGAITFTSSSASASEIYGIFNFSSFATNVSNNSVGGITATNSSTGAAGITGIRVWTGTAVNSTVQNNTVGGTVTNSIQSTSTSTTSAVLGILITLSNTTLTGNTVANLTTASGNGTTTTPAMGGIVVNASSSNHTVTGNRISVLTHQGVASTGHVSGLVFGSTTGANVIGENFIHSLSAASASVVMNGIYVSAGTATYRNNMIRLGIDASGAALTTGMSMNGVNEVAGTNNFYFNSIYIGGSGVGGANNSFAFNSTVVTNVRNFQNNIFFNARSNGAGTGKHYAIRVGGTAANPAGLTSNANILFANGTGGFTGLFNAIDQATIAGWRTATGQDAASLSGNPNFANATGTAGTVDLHVANPTPIEATGVLIAAVTTDFDGQTRSTLSPTDIGADAGNFVLQDISVPVITYSQLFFTCSTTDRVFSATITDGGGVPTTGPLQPRVYYRKNAGPWFSSQGVLATGTAQNGTWNFTIVASDMGGVALGDAINYYVIAQDLAGNLVSNPTAGLVASDVNTVTTAPTTPNAYTINNSMAGGTYTVGVGGNYTTLTAAVTDYNINCIGGPIVFLLTDATYPSETFPITINQNGNASAVNTLTIRPQTTSTISGSANNNALIRIMGNYVTIDGSNNSTTTRDLTISNTSVTTPSIILIASTGVTPVTNSGVKNCILINGVNTSSGVVVSDATLGTQGYFNNITLQNNSVQRAFIGIYAIAAVTGTNGSGLVISNNSLNTSGANAIRRVGVYVQGVNGATVATNTIGNFEAATAEVDFAIWLATSATNIAVTGNTISPMTCTATSAAPTGIFVSSNVAAANIAITGNSITQLSSSGGTTGASTNGIQVGFATEGVTITGNTIGQIFNTISTSGWGANGILLASTSATANITVANNFIYDVAGYGFSGTSTDDNGAGIAVNSGAGYSIYHNTVRLTVSQTTVGSQPAAMFVAAGVTAPGAINLRNNIFVTTQGVTTERYAIRSIAASTVFAAIDYNDYFSSGPNVGFIGSNRANLAAIQTGFGSNTNSVSASPVFMAPTDLHLVSGSNPLIEDKGVFIATVTTDIDGQTRNTCSPDMGADEFGTPVEINVQGNSVTIVDGDVTPGAGDHTSFGTMSVCNGTISRTYTIQNTGGIALNITSAAITGANAADFTITTAAVSPVAPAGSTTIVVTFDPSAAGIRTATLTINSSDCDEAAYDFTIAGSGTQIAATLATQTNLNCNGDGSGNAAVNVTGGVAPITYLWTPAGGTTSTATGLSAGSYTCTTTDANGCTAQVFVTITEPTVVIASVSATTDVTCNNASTGAATVTASGGSGTLTYAWAPSGGTSATAMGLMAGSYTCTVTDGNGCTATAITSITEPTAITASVSSQTDVACNSTMTGDATVTASGGTGTLTYAWAPAGGNAATATGLAAGTYTCTVTDANGCTATAMATITEPTAIASSVSSQTNVSCNAGTNGAATVTASGGTGTLTYAWAPSGGNAPTATGLAAGIYTCTVTDANACTSMQVVTITEPSVLTAVLGAQTNVTCNSATTGSAAVTAAGGTGTLLYAWTPTGGNAATASGLGAGTYTCTVTDANGCTATAVATITQPTAITASVSSTTNVTCFGNPNGSATVTASGGTGTLTYMWSPAGGTAATSTGVIAGTYTCTVTDANGCTAAAIATITQPTAVTASVSSQTNVACNAASTGAATVTASGGTGTLTYAWAPTGGNAATATALMAGTYTCTVTDANGCTATAIATITQPTVVTAVISSSTNVACNAASTGSATVSAGGGIGTLTYAWTPSGGNAAVAPGLIAGTYTCTVTDANGCTATAITTITQPSAIASSVVSTTNATCGNNNGAITITASGGTGTLTYAWAPTGGTAATATGLNAGSYTCTITDANGCTRTQIASVNNIGGPVVSLASSTNVSCFGGSNGAATVTATGVATLTYAWAPTGGTAASASGLIFGTYTCTVTDGNGCIQTQTVSITQPPAITSSISSSTNVSCFGGSNGAATVTASGGTGTLTYAWAPTGGNAATTTGRPQGTYTCTITDANGCTRQQTVTITQPTVITSTVTAQTNVSCNAGSNGSATVAASGGTGAFTYAWTPSGGNAATASGLAFGTYTCTITDVNGCTRQQTVTITQPTVITSTVTAQTNVSCNAGSNGSATVAASGGTGAFTYAWTPSGGNAATASGLAFGTYTCTITDVNGCTRQQTVTITQPTVITSTVTAQTNVSCNAGSNGSATVAASGGTGAFTYAWTPSGGNAATASGLAFGTYTCTITDVNGCTRQQTVSITQPTAITSTVTAQTSVSCFGGNNASATVAASGGTGAFTYAWTPTGGNAATASGLAFGTYTCTITDVNGCTRQQTVSITQPTAITSTVTAQTSVSCFGGNNASATVAASGGTGAFTYAWTPSGGNAATASGLAFGTYTCTITDVNGCTRQQTVSITQPTVITSTVTASTNVSCNGGNNGSATVAASGGTGAFTYAWTPSGGNAATASGLGFGTYTCTITDVNGCTRQQTVTITQPTVITSTVTASTNVSCFGGSNGSATVAASGGTGAFTYAWTPSGGNAATTTGRPQGTYTCTITDANGCTRQQTVTITQPTVITSTVTAQTSVSCFGGNNASATVAASGGTGAFTYAWTPTGGNAATATGLAFGTYTCTITDVNGCTRQQTVSITQPTVITSTVTAQTSVTCNGGNNASATVAASGGTGAFTYAWTPTGGNAATATALAAGTYTCTITDVNGCTRQQTVTITQPTVITANITAQTNVTCNGGSTGAATVAATGGTGTLTYSWAPTGGTAATASGLMAGVYTVTVTDANTCTRTATVNITQPFAISSSVSSVTNATCGSSNGSATISASGGTGTLTYSWAPTGGNAATASGIAAGGYTVTITDASGCTHTQFVAVSNQSGPTVAVTSTTNVSCFGGNNGAASVVAFGGTGILTYDWTGTPTGDGTPSVTGLTQGVYICMVTDQNGCIGTTTVNITQPPTIASFVSAQTNVSCFGGNNGAATVTSSGGTGMHFYSWSSGSTTASETGLAMGTYTVTITDMNGCSHVQLVTITQPTPVVASVAGSTNVTCFGGNDGSATVTASGGTGTLTYSWAPTGGNAAAATGLTAGSYTCTIADANGCSLTATVSITEPVQLTVIAIVSDDTVCFGEAVTFNGSGTASSYGWSSGVTDNVPFTPSVTDTYTVTGIDGLGCTNTATVTVVVNALPSVTANVSSATVCETDSVTFTGSGTSTSYVWTGGVTDGMPFEMIVSDSYTVTGTDVNGCSNTATVAVTVNAIPVVDLGPDQTSCPTTIVLDALNPGETYMWIDSSAAQTLAVTSTGTYWVDVTNTFGCTVRDSVLITINANPVVTLGADTTICGASLMLDAGNAGATYLWADSTMAQTLSATASGMYTVVVTDTTTGCSGTDSINVVLNPAVVVMLGADTAVCGGTVTLDAGNAGATYLWLDSTMAQTLTAASSGMYSVVVMDTATGCWGTDSINVTINALPVVNLGVDSVQCGGSITLDAGPFLNVSFMWSDSTTAQTLTATTSGNYSVVVTDSTGCSGTDSVNVTINALPVLTFALSQDTICDQDADLVLTGGPVGGSFSGNGVTGFNFDPSSLSGIQVITYTFTDTNGCFANAMDSILVDPCTGIIEGAVTLGMNVYPNPNYGHFFVELNYVPTDVVTIEVTNALGQVVKTIQTSSTMTEIDIQMFEGGVYNVRVFDGGTIFTGRIIKE